MNKVIMPPKAFVPVTILNPEIPKDYPEHRGIALDILVQTSSGERVLVEMQAQDHKWFRERAVYYASRTYGNQAYKGCRLILDDKFVNLRGGIDGTKARRQSRAT